MPRVRYCIPCATGTRPVETIATQTVDDDPMCDFHAREAGAPVAEVKASAAPIATEPVPVEAPVVATRSRACVACASLNIVQRATTEFEGDPMCDHHGFMARRKMLVKTCSRGCGKPTHRGACAGAEGGRASLPPQRTASPAALEAVDRDQRRSLAEVERVVTEAPQTVEERKDHLDKLVGEEIALDALPPMLRPSRNSHGRIGELMAWLKNAPEDKAFAAKCRDVKHVSQTHKGVRDAAKRLGIRFFWRRHDATYYISRSEFEGGVPAWE